jgi:HK97 gp10 family phage protein
LKQLGFEIEGVEKLIHALSGLPDKVSKVIVKKAIREAMKPVAAKVRELAPKDTGAPKQSVKVRATKRKRGRLGVVVSISSGHFKGDQYYGSFQEFGTTKMEGKHFMKEAAKLTRQAAAQRAIDLITQGIEDYIKGN